MNIYIYMRIYALQVHVFYIRNYLSEMVKFACNSGSCVQTIFRTIIEVTYYPYDICQTKNKWLGNINEKGQFY